MEANDSPTIRRIGDSWHVITDGSSVGFGALADATEYAATLECPLCCDPAVMACPVHAAWVDDDIFGDSIDDDEQRYPEWMERNDY